VLSRYAVQDNFQYLNIDNYKTGVYKEMHYCNQRVPEHLFLPKGDQKNIFPSLRSMISQLFLPSQQDIPSDLPHLAGKKPGRKNA
jgi:hypothetical protein